MVIQAFCEVCMKVNTAKFFLIILGSKNGYCYKFQLLQSYLLHLPNKEVKLLVVFTLKIQKQACGRTLALDK